MKQTLKTGLSLLLIFALLCLPIQGLQAQTIDALSPFAVTDETLSEAREQYLAASEQALFPNASEREVVYIEDSNIIHKPQEYETPEPPSLFAPFADYPVAYAGPFAVNDTRIFHTSNTNNVITGKLVAQSEHTNIWVLDNTDYHAKTGTACVNCHLNDITPAIGQQIADRFDPIYNAMTDPTTGFGAHKNVKIQTGFSNMPAIGDIAGDGRINFLLYDIDGDGGTSGSYTAGFFWNGDFFTDLGSGVQGNGLDMLHVDIGKGQGYNVLTTGTEEDRLGFYGTMAHEFQHLLYYIHYGVYTPNSGYDSDSWINETLAELANAFYTDKGKELVSFSRLSSAAENTYDGSGYRDFLNHAGLKSYGMEKMFAHVLYKQFTNIPRAIYTSMTATYPPAQSNAQLAANTAKITSMPQAVGDFLKAGTGIGTGGQNTMALLYYLFMESFAADGGMIYTDPEAMTTKPFSPTTSPYNNLWAARPVLGVSNGRVYADMSVAPYGGYYPANGYEVIPMLSSGGAISLVGHGTPNGRGATHEKLHKLTGGGAGTPYLTITAPNDGITETRYYVAVPQDTLITGSYTYTSGANGASLYPLTKGEAREINTEGKDAYLFVVTLYKNVDSSITYSWSAVSSTTPEDTPAAMIDYTAEELIGFTPGALYTLNGNNCTADASGRGDISALIPANGSPTLSLSIIKKGNGVTTTDSAPQINLSLPARPVMPTLAKTNCTASDADDGTISGVDATMEYRGDGGDWTGCAGATISGLSPGRYEMRVKATGSSFRSQIATVVIFIEGIEYGNVKGYGEIDYFDVTLLLQYLAKWDVAHLVKLDNANVKGHGEIDYFDVTLLLQYLAKWDVILGPTR